MKAIFKKINFNIEDVMKEELPMMEYIYASKRQLKEDLSSLLYYPEKHQSNMPFYTLKEKSAENAAHTYNKLYIMLLAALDKLFKEDFNVIKKYFGTDFISQHPYFVDYARYTFKNKHPALYGRFDSAFDPETEKVKAVYEFNGDTPVMLFESVLLENRFIQEITGDSLSLIHI